MSRLNFHCKILPTGNECITNHDNTETLILSPEKLWKKAAGIINQ